MNLPKIDTSTIFLILLLAGIGTISFLHRRRLTEKARRGQAPTIPLSEDVERLYYQKTNAKKQ